MMQESICNGKEPLKSTDNVASKRPRSLVESNASSSNSKATPEPPDNEQPCLKKSPISRRLSIESHVSSGNEPPGNGTLAPRSLKNFLSRRRSSVLSNASTVITDNCAVNNIDSRKNEELDGKEKNEGKRSSLSEEQYLEFVNKKISSHNRSTCSEPTSIGSVRTLPSDFVNAQRLKVGAISEANDDANALVDNEFNVAERFNRGTGPGGVRNEIGQMLTAEVQAVGETNEDLTEEEERMIAAIDSSWRRGEEVRRMMDSMTSSDEEDEEVGGTEEGAITRRLSWLRTSRAVQATLVEETLPLPPPVEGIPLEEDLAQEALRKKVLKRYRVLVVFLSIVVMVSTAGFTVGYVMRQQSLRSAEDGESLLPEQYQPTLLQIQKEGILRCGIPENKRGLSSYNNITGELEGMSIDLCTAVAIAVIGIEYRVVFITVTTVTRFTALKNRDIDLLIYGDTHTMERDFHEKATGAGFQFSDPYFYDGLGFAGLPRAVECADKNNWLEECSDLSICVMTPSTHQDVLSPSFPRQKLRPMVTYNDYLQAFINGTCLVLAGEQFEISQEALFEYGYKGEYSYGQQKMSKEPLAMVTRKGNNEDQSWSDICNLVLRSLMHAEQQNITQLNARDKLPDIPFVSVLETVGNYGEVYARHMEQVVPRSGGMNQLYDHEKVNSSGLHYSHPFGSIDESYHEFDPSGTIHKIIERGKLICGVFDNEYQSLDKDYCRSLAASLFDSNTYLVEFVQLSDDDSPIERMKSGEIDVIAGANRSLGNILEVMASSNQTEFNALGFSFSKPYFYGENSSRALATSKLDADWSSFVYWVVEVSVWAEENSIISKDFQKVPEVQSFGSRFEWMFKGSILGGGNYAEIYNRNNDTLPERNCHNLLNDGSSPQLYPPQMNVFVIE